MTGTTTSGAETRAHILEAAARLICERGYEGASMADIAAACRLTKAGLYHHFEGKEQLLLAIQDYGMDLFEAQVLSQVQQIPDPLERLRACMARNITLVTRGWSKEVTVILHEHDTLTGKARAHINGRKKRYIRFLEGSFQDAIARGQVREDVDPKLAAFAFLGMVLWIYKWFRPDQGLSDDRIAAGMVDLLLHGVTTRRTR